MGSVISDIECPRCKSENCSEEFYYKTGEEYISCLDCGYHRTFHYRRDSEGNFIKKDETKGYEVSNFIPEEIHLENPFGAYRVETNLGGATCGTLETEEDYKKFVSEIISLSDQEHNMKEAIVSRFLDGEIKKEVVFSNGNYKRQTT